MEAGGGGGRAAAPATYCVTGSTGYLGSWLVKLLLQKGYRVHATARDPEKASPLLALWRGDDRLRLFRAELQEQGSFDEALRGCVGVFHVAASMQFNVHNNCTNLEEYVESKIIYPAIRATENLLESCLKSGSVKRVVFTSSISTITAKDSSGEWRRVVDEFCQTPIEHVWNTKASGWVYVLSKLCAENAAFRVASEKGIDLVSVITTTVGGPFLTSNIPSSIQMLLSPITATGDSNLFGILSAVNSRMGSVALVHINDICSAHLFLMEEPKAQGKYICCSCSCPMDELINLFIHNYHSSCSNSLEAQSQGIVCIPSEISSKKLTDLGFSYKHGLEEVVIDTIKTCVDHGFLASSI